MPVVARSEPVAAPQPATSHQLVAQLKERIAQAKERSAAPRMAEPNQPAEMTEPSDAVEQEQELPPGDSIEIAPEEYAGDSTDEVLMDQEPAGQSTPNEDAFISDKDQGLSFL